MRKPWVLWGTVAVFCVAGCGSRGAGESRNRRSSVAGDGANDPGPAAQDASLLENGMNSESAVAPVADGDAGGIDQTAVRDRVPYQALAVAAGEAHTCALLDDHQIKCWGDNDFGELGYGDQVARGNQPSEMGDALPIVDLGTGRHALAVAAGRYATCAILDNGSAKCWGWAQMAGKPDGAVVGNIGDKPGEIGDHLPPIDLGAGRTARLIAVGRSWPAPSSTMKVRHAGRGGRKHPRRSPYRCPRDARCGRSTAMEATASWPFWTTDPFLI